MRRVRALLGVAALLLAPVVAAQGFVAAPVERDELAGGIAGRVCRDLDQDGLCGAAEPGLPGIRVVLETGQSALTDRQGRYHLAAVSARAPDGAGGVHLLPGRHRLVLDGRALAAGSVVTPPRVTVELPMGGLWVQDFAVRAADTAPVAVVEAPSTEVVAPLGVLQPDERVRFLITGVARPGDEVRVSGKPAQVDGEGQYRIWTQLGPGENDLDLTFTSPTGAVRLFRERVDVISLPGGGALIYPHPPEPEAAVQLPAGKDAKAATGPGTLRFEGEPGTRVRHPLGVVVVGQDGAAEIPIDLRSGENAVPLTIERPGRPAREDSLAIPAAPRPLLIGLLDLEGGLSLRGGFRLTGRGAAHAEYRLGDWSLAGELELRDTDLTALRDGGAATLLLPRRPERLERALDPEAFPVEWGDRSVGVVPNSAEGRLRLEARHETYGVIGLGTHRAVLEDTEIGRFERELFGPYASLTLPIGDSVKLGVDGFFAPGAVDPTRGITTTPAHDELTATGGSLYYLGSGGIAEGSEVLRVELRDALTRIPLAERHLVRGRDYELDALSGRVLLAQPLSFVAPLGRSASVLGSEPFSSSAEQVLVADYERLELGGSARRTIGGQVRAQLGPVRLSAGAVEETTAADRYQLYRARVAAPLGPITVFAEAAQSWGGAMDPSAFTLSDDGGFTALRPGPRIDAGGQALTVHAKGPGLTAAGQVDASFRYRSAGFSDREHDDRALLRQFSLRAEQPIGPVVVGVIADQQTAADPRVPFEGKTYSSRTLAASVGYRRPEWEARLEVKDAELTAAVDPAVDVATETGGRTSVGAYVRYRVLPALDLSLSHKQVLAIRDVGPGAVNDGFSALGADLHVREDAVVGVRAGWGPVLGPLAWLQGQYQVGETAYYGGYSVDVDGPDFGQAKAVSGARTDVGDGSTVFVEDTAAHDATALRLSRAVGFSERLGTGVEVSARYERGVSTLFDLPSTLQRDAAGLSARYVSEKLRLFARGEGRFERGRPERGPVTEVQRFQWLVSAGAELDLLDSLRASARINASDTYNLGLPEATLVELSAGLAWRFEHGMAVLHYALTQEQPPPARGFGERRLQVLSLQPAFRIGSRVTLSAGANAGWSSEQGATTLVFSGSIRPAVRVVGGLEVAVELARRSSAPDGGELNALRGEVGYRFDDRFVLALGYTVLGYSGLGLAVGESDRQDRVYLRAELAY